MIPFNIFGHTHLTIVPPSEPIVWVDSDDASSYVLQPVLGSELVANGTFNLNTSGWTGDLFWQQTGTFPNFISFARLTGTGSVTNATQIISLEVGGSLCL